MHRHVASGLPDSRGQQTRAQLLASGVAVKAAVKGRQPRAGSTRWHVHYAAAKLCEYKHHNPNATSSQIHDMRAQWFREWNGLSASEQEDFKKGVVLRGGAALAVASVKEPAPARPADGAAMWPSYVGNNLWPISPDSLETMLMTAPGSSGKSARGGVPTRFRPIRARSQKDHLVKDSGAIPPGKIDMPSSCPELHHGVCVSRDAEHVDQISKVCAALCRHQGLGSQFLVHQRRWR